jgi:4-methylaminobutanoate oxidase (formaldehyde-forming)
MGYVENAAGLADRNFVMGGRYEIEVAGVRVPAAASMSGFYDPAGLRVKDVGRGG